MNTAYNYKNNAKNVNSYNVNSKKGTVTPLAYDKTSQTDFLEKSLSFIDAIVELLSSARLLIGAKAFFAFIALLGFFGVIGGIELGTVSLFSGIIALALIIGAEFLILKD